MNTPSKPCSRAWRIQPGRTPLVQGRLITTTSGEECICELPARSMPGSEMALVEKTRTRGPWAGASPTTGAAGCSMAPGLSSLGPANEDPVVSLGGDGTEEAVADLARPGRDVGLGLGVARPELEHLTDGDAGHRFLGLQQRTRASSAAGVDDLGDAQRRDIRLGQHSRHVVSSSRSGCWSPR